MTFVDIIFIGIGLAVDASCVCTSNGLIYKPSRLSSVKIALVYATFQGIMPLIGYFGIGLFSFKLFEYNHIIALILLSLIGIMMIYESLDEKKQEVESQNENVSRILTKRMLLIQGVSTSIDALSVGITLHQYDIYFVIYGAILIAVITLFMCFLAVRIGIKIGVALNHKAELVGGLVLVILGIKIFVTG